MWLRVTKLEPESLSSQTLIPLPSPKSQAARRLKAPPVDHFDQFTPEEGGPGASSISLGTLLLGLRPTSAPDSTAT